MKQTKYSITLTERQLRLIANCVEDIHRFIGGQMELWNTATCLTDYLQLRERLKELKPLVTPGLPYNASYGWSGGSCPNEHQRKFLAETYCIYREILHVIAVDNHKEGDPYNVYLGETLTCEEGGELPQIKKV